MNAIIGLVLILTSGLPATSETPKSVDTTTINWQKKELVEGQFSHSYILEKTPEIYCEILVRKDGSGILLRLCGFDGNENVSQLVSIVSAVDLKSQKPILIVYKTWKGSNKKITGPDLVANFIEALDCVNDPMVKACCGNYPVGSQASTIIWLEKPVK